MEPVINSVIITGYELMHIGGPEFQLTKVVFVENFT